MRMLLSQKGFNFKMVLGILAIILVLGYAVYAATYTGSAVPNPDGKKLKTVRVTGVLDFNPQIGQPLTIAQLHPEVTDNSIITGTCKTGELAIGWIPTASNIQVLPQVWDPKTNTWYTFSPCQSKDLDQFSQTTPIAWEFKVPPGKYRTRALIQGDLSGLGFDLGRKTYISTEVEVIVNG